MNQPTPFDEIDAPIEFGTATFSHKENSAADVKFDRLSHDGSTLNLISLVAESQKIKAIRAILHASSGSPSIKPRGITTRHPSNHESWARRGPGTLSIAEKGYETHMHRLDYGMVHALFVCRDPNFIRYLSPKALWEKLNSERHSTPLLPEWMPYVTERLVYLKYLRECRCFRSNSGVLALANDDQLDEIVTDGLKDGKIQIPTTPNLGAVGGGFR